MITKPQNRTNLGSRVLAVECGERLGRVARAGVLLKVDETAGEDKRVARVQRGREQGVCGRGGNDVSGPAFGRLSDVSEQVCPFRDGVTSSRERGCGMLVCGEWLQWLAT